MAHVTLKKAKVRGPRQNLRKQQVETGSSAATSTRKNYNLMVESIARGDFRHLPEIRKPPGEVSSLRITRRVLYTMPSASAPSSQSFYKYSGCGAFLMAPANGTPTCYSYVDCWRIKRLRFFLLNTDSDEAVRVIFTPDGTDSGGTFVDPDSTRIMVSESTAEPNVYEYRPSRFHPLGCWKRTDALGLSDRMFLMQCSPIDNNSYVEIEYEMILNLTGGLHGFTVVPTSSVTLGSYYTAVWGDTANGLYPVGVNAVTLP